MEENITLIPDDLMLDEVVITQRLPQFRLDNGGLTTKVENTILSKAGTAMNVVGAFAGSVEEAGWHVGSVGKRRSAYLYQ